MQKEINIQNQILNFVRKEKELITVFLISGKKFVGYVQSFDKYTIHLKGKDFDQVIFKHAITNISIPHQTILKMFDGKNDVDYSLNDDYGESEGDSGN